MLKRIRIEVEESSADLCVEAMNRYEQVIHLAEAQRYGFLVDSFLEAHRDLLPNGDFLVPQWVEGTTRRSFYNDELGREITEEVIEYDPTIPGYKGRRVVQYRRLDTRS